MNQIIINKMILLGDSNKTRLRRSYFGECFSQDHTKILGADFSIFKSKFNQKITIEYQIWELDDRPMFNMIKYRFFRGVKNIAFAFKLPNNNFDRLVEKIVQENFEYIESNSLNIILFLEHDGMADSELNNYRVRFNRIIAKSSNNIRIEKLFMCHGTNPNQENIDECFQKLNNIIFVD